MNHVADQAAVDRPATFALLEMNAFKTNALMLSEFDTRKKYRKIISQLDLDAIIKATANCPLNDIGFSNPGPTYELAQLWSQFSTQTVIPQQWIRGATPPTDRELLDWLANVEPKSTQTHSAIVAALTKAGVDPVNLKAGKLWLDLRTSWSNLGREFLSDWSNWQREVSSDWTLALRPFATSETNPGLVPPLFRLVTDFAQFTIHCIYGFVSDFGLRPAKSLIIALFIICSCLIAFRTSYGRVAFLAIPTDKLDTNSGATDLTVFERHNTEWQEVTWLTVAKVMVPSALTAVPLLGSLLNQAGLDWSKQTVVAFRRVDRYYPRNSPRTRLRTIAPSPRTGWASFPTTPPLTVLLPQADHKLTYLRRRVSNLVSQTRGRPVVVQSADPSIERWLPGLIVGPQSGSVYSTLNRWSWYGYGIAAALVAGIIALFKL